MNGNIYVARLENQNSMAAMNGDRVYFDVSPEITESRNVNYTTLDPVHAPGQIYVYKNTQSRNFNLSNVRLVSRSQNEATVNLMRLQILRSWSLPWFAYGAHQGISSPVTSTANQESRSTPPVGEGGRKTNSSDWGFKYKGATKVRDAQGNPIGNSGTSGWEFGEGQPATSWGSRVAGSTIDLEKSDSVAPGFAEGEHEVITNPTKPSAGVQGPARTTGILDGALKVGRSIFDLGKSILSPTQQETNRSMITGNGIEPLGTPPAVLLFSAYSPNAVHYTYDNIRRVPVVMQQMSINYPTDVDYIPTVTNIPFPTVMSLDITLVETHAPIEYEAFNLMAFKAGQLLGY